MKSKNSKNPKNPKSSRSTRNPTGNAANPARAHAGFNLSAFLSLPVFKTRPAILTRLSRFALFAQLERICRDAGTALGELSWPERILHVLWLLGPFIFLIERTPADAWISVLAIAFLARSAIRRDGAWLKTWWVQSCFGFLWVCLFSAAFSALPGYAFEHALAWFRFPLFAMATVFWLARDKRLLYAMLLSVAVGLIVMCGILLAEFIIEGQKNGRLVWPYDDLVPGNYLAKAGLPAFILMAAFAVTRRSADAVLFAIAALVVMAVALITGERVNSIILVCSAVVASLFCRPRLARLAVVYLAGAVGLVAMLVFVDGLTDRFIAQTLAHLPYNTDSIYYAVMRAGFLPYLDNPVVGLGPATYRELCPVVLPAAERFACSNHPHNYYIQLMGETGTVGLVAGVLMIGCIFARTVAAGLAHRENVVAATAFVVPLALFFPIATNTDFFGQWNNSFMWSALALSLAAGNIKKGTGGRKAR